MFASDTLLPGIALSPLDYCATKIKYLKNWEERTFVKPSTIVVQCVDFIWPFFKYRRFPTWIQWQRLFFVETAEETLIGENSWLGLYYVQCWAQPALGQCAWSPRIVNTQCPVRQSTQWSLVSCDLRLSSPANISQLSRYVIVPAHCPSQLWVIAFSFYYGS